MYNYEEMNREDLLHAMRLVRYDIQAYEDFLDICEAKEKEFAQKCIRKYKNELQKLYRHLNSLKKDYHG